jgi:hypothetical protein
MIGGPEVSAAQAVNDAERSSPPSRIEKNLFM